MSASTSLRSSRTRNRTRPSLRRTSVTTGGLSESKVPRPFLKVRARADFHPYLRVPSRQQRHRLRQPHRHQKGQTQDPRQARLVGTVEFLKDLVRRMFFHPSNDVEHLWNGELMFGKHRPCEIIKNALTVLTTIALSVLSRCSFLDRVRTAAVRARHLVRPSLFTQIL